MEKEILELMKRQTAALERCAQALEAIHADIEDVTYIDRDAGSRIRTIGIREDV